MFLKRLAAILVAFVLIIQLAGCSQNIPVENSSYTDTSANSTQSGVVEDNKPQQNNSSDVQSNNSLVEGTTDNSSEETPNNDTASSENQYVDAPQQDNDQETNKDNIVTGCNHGEEDPYLEVSKTEFYADYKTACCNTDANYRSKHGLLSGYQRFRSHSLPVTSFF